MKRSNWIRLALMAAMGAASLPAATPAASPAPKATAAVHPLAAASLERLLDLQGGHPGLLAQRAGTVKDSGAGKSVALLVGIGAAVVVVAAAWIGGHDIYQRAQSFYNYDDAYAKNIKVSANNINSNTVGNTTVISGTITITNNNSNINYKTLLPSF